MAYKDGTYIAFDGLGETDPTRSDFKYYATIQAWAKNKSIKFEYTDSHDKTSAVRDTSLKSTLQARIRERLSNSKNVLVILSSDTRKTGSMLSYEIEQAVDTYKLPLIIAYVDYDVVASPHLLSNYWPNALSSRIGNESVKAIHIPFVKDAILDAIGQFNISDKPGTSKNYYTEAAHRNFGVLPSYTTFTNKKK